MARKKVDSGKENNEKGPITPRLSIVPRSITDEMKDSYIDYAMSVIMSRALPDVRDGLKPVHRRILFAMNSLGLTSSAKFRKSATVVGEVLGNYHPHGDAAVYDSLVQMAQDFKMRTPLVHGQGNFGNIDGDNAAAMRYTEAKMSKVASELMRDIDKDTVNFMPNYDGTRKEPTVLPAAYPNLLANGTLGIAVGMATNIPPHNLREIISATMHLIDNKDATTEDLLGHIQGPDFPTGGIIFNKKDIHHAYATGKGGVVTRGVAEIVEDKKGAPSIIISSIPFRVNKADLIVKIADLVRDKRLEGIRDIRDESTDEIRVAIDLKGNAHPQKVLNALYKHTQLEETFHFNLVALLDGVPQTVNLKGMLEAFVSFRKEVIKRRTAYDLAKAKDKEHILLGLKRALDHIDKIIKLIKAAKDAPTAHKDLMKEFKFSDRQATAILEMRLQKLAGLERKKIEDELKATQELIKELEAILKSAQKIRDIIKEELRNISDTYGNDRKTKVVSSGVKNISVEDLVPDEENMLVMTAGGYIKRTSPDEYKRQRRGGVGVVDLNTKEEDFVTHFLKARAHSDLLFFTDRGKVYQIKMYDLPEGRRATRGKSIMNFLSLEADEEVTSILPMPKEIRGKDVSVMMVTKDGTTKRVAAENFHDVRRGGIIAIKLAKEDTLVSAEFVEKDDTTVIVTKKGQAIRFKSNDIREMGRSAAGVRGMKISKGDIVISAGVIPKESEKTARILVMAEKGYGKATPANEYKIQNRGGSGIKTAKVSDKTGVLVGGRILIDQEELVAMSKKSQVIRVETKEIPSLGRQTQGVRIMKLRAGDALASMICL